MPLPWSAARSRLSLLLAAGLACAGFWWLGPIINFPDYPGHNSSLLLQPLATAKVLAVVVAFLIIATLGTLLAGRVRYDAGWAWAAVSLYALRLRGGPIGSTIADQPPRVFLVLALELILLALVLGITWTALHRLRERGTAFKTLRRFLELPEATMRLADRKAAAESLDQKFLAIVLCAATMAVFIMILCRTGERAQVFFSVGISAYLAVWITHAFIPTRPAIWFWSGPILCGLVGYLWAWSNTSPSQLAIHDVGGFLAPLARPLPLDYASIGVGAAVWRYVQSRTHQLHAVIEAQRNEAAPAASAAAQV